ncbi:hypothetical protein CARUB_v10012676mg [Capsella rubella]|uniref:Uncharacterized protein n=1 Tax=Capsella rubella TaxID=81985 RepID=R0IIQ0_9BRAS|nr:hypothetical protein CARUB_v10012676mg [Capsella rubella]
MLLTCDTSHPFIVLFLFCSSFFSVRTLNFCLNVKLSSILSVLGVKSNYYLRPSSYIFFLSISLIPFN